MKRSAASGVRPPLATRPLGPGGAPPRPPPHPARPLPPQRLPARGYLPGALALSAVPPAHYPDQAALVLVLLGAGLRVVEAQQVQGALGGAQVSGLLLRPAGFRGSLAAVVGRPPAAAQGALPTGEGLCKKGAAQHRAAVPGGWGGGSCQVGAGGLGAQALGQRPLGSTACAKTGRPRVGRGEARAGAAAPLGKSVNLLCAPHAS